MIEALMRERGISFKRALNESVRTGLERKAGRRNRKFSQTAYPLGAEQYFRWDKALAVAETIEDEELARKLALRK